MKTKTHQTGGRMKKLLVVALLSFFLMSSAAADDAIFGPLAHAAVSGFFDIINGGIEFMLDVYETLITLNPDPEDVKPLADSFIKMLFPVYVIAVMVTGFYWIFLSISPRSRAKAKGMLLKLLISMPLVMSSTAIFQLMLDLSTLLTNFIFSLAKVDVSMFTVALAAAVVLITIGTGPLGAPIIIGFLFGVVTVMLAMSALRYILLFFMAAIFPLTLFLLLFDLTKDIGMKIMRYTIMTAFMPALQAFFIVFTITAMNGGLDYSNLLSLGGLLSTFAAALARMALLLGGCILIILSPFIMLGLMKWMGLFLVGWAFGNMGAMAARYGGMGQKTCIGLVLAGGLLAGEGPGAIPLAGSLWFIQQLGPHTSPGNKIEPRRTARFIKEAGQSFERTTVGGRYGGMDSDTRVVKGQEKLIRGETTKSPPEFIAMEKFFRGELNEREGRTARKEFLEKCEELIGSGRESDHGEAQRMLERAIKLAEKQKAVGEKPLLKDAEIANLHGMAGDASMRLNKIGGAVEHYTKAEKLDPSKHEYSLKRGDALFKQG